MAQVFKSAALDAARIAGRDPGMDEAAAAVLSRAQAIAVRHRLTGAYSASFSVEEAKGKRGVTDRLVVNTDPAAVSIEFGHQARSATGNGKQVPGQHVLGQAASQS